MDPLPTPPHDHDCGTVAKTVELIKFGSLLLHVKPTPDTQI